MQHLTEKFRKPHEQPCEDVIITKLKNKTKKRQKRESLTSVLILIIRRDKGKVCSQVGARKRAILLQIRPTISRAMLLAAYMPMLASQDKNMIFPF